MDINCLSGVLSVYCDLADTVNPKTVVNNNVEWKLEVQGYESSYGYPIYVTYDPPVTFDQFEVMVVSNFE